MFTTILTAKPKDIDRRNSKHHIRHRTYFDYFEVARDELLDDLGFSVETLRDEHGIDLVVAESNIIYRNEIFPEDNLTILTAISFPNSRYIFMKQDMYYSNPDKLVSEGSFVLAMKNKKIISPIKEFVEAVNNYLNQ